MAAQVECSVCGVFVHSGPVMCLDCAKNIITELEGIESALRADMVRLTRTWGAEVGRLMSLNSDLEEKLAAIKADPFKPIREMGYHDVEQFYQTAPSNHAVHLTPAAGGSCADNDTEPQAQVTADR